MEQGVYKMVQPVGTRLVNMLVALAIVLMCVFGVRELSMISVCCLMVVVPTWGFCLARLVTGSPLLTVDCCGVTDSISLINLGLLPWDEITSADAYVHGKQIWVSIDLRDFDAFCAGKHCLQRLALRLNKALLARPVLLCLPRKDCDLAALRAAVAHYRPVSR